MSLPGLSTKGKVFHVITIMFSTILIIQNVFVKREKSGHRV